MLRRFVVLVLLACALSFAPAFADEKLVVFAAASLKTALDAAAAKYPRRRRPRGEPELWRLPRPCPADSAAGAPADVFISRRRAFDGRGDR